MKNCLACNSDKLVLTLNLNEQPLANSFKLNQNEKQTTFPLAINRCQDCCHVQLTHAVNPDLMFKDYLYVSGTSKTMDEHFKMFSRYSIEYWMMINQGSLPKSVFDIGCNDGSQLNHYSKFVKTFGIDPAENLHELSSKNHNVYCDYFDENFINNKKEESYDIIVAQNVFAHNYDPVTFLKTAKKIMNETSLLFIQTSQANMILNNEFDTIYHEHISFYNIKSMQKLCTRVGLNLIDVTKCPLHGTSYIFVISNSVDRSYNIDNLVHMEHNTGLYDPETYVTYADNCNSIVDLLKSHVEWARSEGHYVVGYGAAAKGMTLLNYAGFNQDDFDFIVDDNELKQGRFTPGSSIPIVSSDKITEIPDQARVMFIPLAWNFFDEIKSKILEKRNNNNDMFIRYFPEVKVE